MATKMVKIVRTRVRTYIKRSINQPRRGWYEHPYGGAHYVALTNPEGVGIRAGKPMADRAIRKEKKLPLTNPEGLVPDPEGLRYEHP